MRTAAKYAVVAVVLYLVYRWIVRPNLGGATTTTGAAVKDLPTPSMDRDVSEGCSNPDADPLIGGVDWMIDDIHFVERARDIQIDFMVPASRVRLYADCPREVWSNMFGLLALSLQRQTKRSHRWQDLNALMNDQATGAIVDQVVGSIVSIIAGVVGGPLVSALLKFAYNTQVDQLKQAIAQEQGIVAFVEKLRQTANANKLPASTCFILKGEDNGLSRNDPMSASYQLGAACNMTPEVMELLGLESVQWRDTGQHIAAPTIWFFLTKIGMYLPWVSAELLGPTLRETINKRARVARVLDAYSCMAFPREPDGYAGGRYYYVNKVYGPILGSQFPPTEEDAHYVDAKGMTYAYNGRAIGNYKQDKADASKLLGTAYAQKMSALTNVPGYVPDPNSAEASTGPGEIFYTPEELAAQAEAKKRVDASRTTVSTLVVPPVVYPPPSTTSMMLGSIKLTLP